MELDSSFAGGEASRRANLYRGDAHLRTPGSAKTVPGTRNESSRCTRCERRCLTMLLGRLGSYRCGGCGAATAQVPSVHDPLWQSLLPPQMAATGQPTPQLPPHWCAMSLGLQHLVLTQAKVSQSSPVLQPCASLHRFPQFPLHCGPQQRSPEQVPLWQSSLRLHTPESGHFTPQLLPHRFVKSLGVQHFPLTHA